MATELTIDMDATVNFLVDLLNTHSPTGYHIEAIDYVRGALDALAFPRMTMTTTRKGALLVTIPGASNAHAVGLTAHIDTLGLMVKAIKGNGRLMCTRIGGLMWAGAEFEGVTVRTHDNKRYRGSLSPVNPSTHVNPKIGSMERSGETMEVRLDVKTSSAGETKELGISVGDFVFLDPRVEVSESGFIRSRFLDDKAGVAAIYGALKALKDTGARPAHTTHILISNYEEVGHGGSAGIPEDITELLVVDMGALGDGQTGDEFSVSICAKDASGPYHLDMMNKLRRLATEYNIPFNIDIYVYYQSDGSAFWNAGGDARVGLAGPGIDASHAYERTHKDSIQHSAHLIARYMLDSAV